MAVKRQKNKNSPWFNYSVNPRIFDLSRGQHHIVIRKELNFPGPLSQRVQKRWKGSELAPGMWITAEGQGSTSGQWRANKGPKRLKLMHSLHSTILYSGLDKESAVSRYSHANMPWCYTRTSATELPEGLNTQHIMHFISTLTVSFASIASRGRSPQVARTGIFAPHRLGFL